MYIYGAAQALKKSIGDINKNILNKLYFYIFKLMSIFQLNCYVWIMMLPIKITFYTILWNFFCLSPIVFSLFNITLLSYSVWSFDDSIDITFLIDNLYKDYAFNTFMFKLPESTNLLQLSSGAREAREAAEAELATKDKYLNDYDWTLEEKTWLKYRNIILGGKHYSVERGVFIIDMNLNKMDTITTETINSVTHHHDSKYLVPSSHWLSCFDYNKYIYFPSKFLPINLPNIELLPSNSETLCQLIDIVINNSSDNVELTNDLLMLKEFIRNNPGVFDQDINGNTPKVNTDINSPTSSDGSLSIQKLFPNLEEINKAIDKPLHASEENINHSENSVTSGEGSLSQENIKELFSPANLKDHNNLLAESETLDVKEKKSRAPRAPLEKDLYDEEGFLLDQPLDVSSNCDSHASLPQPSDVSSNPASHGSLPHSPDSVSNQPGGLYNFIDKFTPLMEKLGIIKNETVKDRVVEEINEGEIILQPSSSRTEPKQSDNLVNIDKTLKEIIDSILSKEIDNPQNNESNLSNKTSSWIEKSKVDDLNAKIERYQKELRYLNSKNVLQLILKEKELIELNSRISLLEDNIKDNKTKIKKLVDEMNSLSKHNLNEVQTELDHRQDLINEINDDNYKLNDDLIKYKNKAIDDKEKIESLSKLIELLNNNLIEKDQEISDIINKNKPLENKYNSIVKKLEEQKSELENNNKFINELHDEILDLTMTNRKLRDELNKNKN
jgi:hypothetical protein